MPAPTAAPKKATAPTTAPATKGDTKVKVEAKPDLTLLNLYNTFDKYQADTGKKFAAIISYVKTKKTPRPVLKATLMKRGLTEGSANVECTRIFKLLDNPDLLALYEKGDVSVRAVRKGVAVPRSEKTVTERVQVFLQKAAHLAYGTDEFDSLVTFRTLAVEAWNAEVTAAEQAEAGKDGAPEAETDEAETEDEDSEAEGEGTEEEGEPEE